MIKEIEKILEESPDYIGDDFLISSAFTMGRNIEELRKNWTIHFRKGNKFISVSLKKTEESEPLSDEIARTDLNSYDDRIYKYFEDLSAKLDFNPSNASISLFNGKIKISFFSSDFKVLVCTLDKNGNEISKNKINLIGN